MGSMRLAMAEKKKHDAEAAKAERGRREREERMNRAWMLRGRDEVAPEHQEIHAKLQRWGRWQTERYQQGFCYSIEHRFEGDRNRTTSRAVVALPPDPELGMIEMAILLIPEQHAETIVQYYAKRWAPKTICWAHSIQYEDFARWMHDCRSMVLKRLPAES